MYIKEKVSRLVSELIAFITENRKAIMKDMKPDADRATNSERIVVTPGTCGGRPRIAGHRVKVTDVAVWHVAMGIAPEEIVANWPSLTLEDVDAALDYYRLHRDRIDADILETEEFGEKFFARRPSLLGKAARRSAAAQNDPVPS
jgi:uncharacterized protein (DUF433 family)